MDGNERWHKSGRRETGFKVVKLDIGFLFFGKWLSCQPLMSVSGRGSMLRRLRCESFLIFSKDGISLVMDSHLHSIT